MTQSRRTFVASSALALLGIDPKASPAAEPPPGPIQSAPQGSEITAVTIGEAAKIHAFEVTPEARDRLARSIAGQVAAVRAVRAVPRPLELQPGITFDPRLPGVRYPPQRNRVVLHAGQPPAPPNRDEDIAFAPVTALSAWIRAGRLTSRRLTEIYLERIQRIDGKLFSWITVTEDVARRQADQADRERKAGRSRGPLHGIPYGIKDLFDTAGIATTWGAAPYRNRVPTTNSAVVGRLEQAGAVLLGKLATGALANGATWFGGQCRNPWNPEEPAGGSSTGSGSATAAGLCGFSIGTDSLGSILNPADRCGVVGLRATFGRIPTAGAMPLTPSLDRIGPICRGVEDAALVLAAINASDLTSATSIDMGFDYRAALDLSRLTVGISPAWFQQVGFGPGASVPASEAHHAARRALEALGVKIVEVALPSRPYFALINNLMVEAAAVFEELALSGRDRELPEDNASSWPESWRQIRFLSAVDYLQFERLRRLIMNDFHQIFERVDLLFGPTYGSFELLMATNFTGHPGLSMRAGFTESPTRGIAPTAINPSGPKHRITQNVAFHGRLFEEGKMLALARALEARLAVSGERPSVG
jgi:Asp-tRNA(Asn)/Glu-tRNA(Gln) amidotransferase A subunit family amidase